MSIDDMYQVLFDVAHETTLNFEVLDFPGPKSVTLRSNKLSTTLLFLTEEEFSKNLRQFAATIKGASSCATR